MYGADNDAELILALGLAQSGYHYLTEPDMVAIL